MIETITPENERHWLELRTLDVTSTEVSALFDCSPYLTHFELWHRKRNNTVVDMVATERMKWGTRLQDSIAKGIGEDQGWYIRRMYEYKRDTDLRIGASFDFEILAGAVTTVALLEIKNVDSLAFKEGWLIDGDDIEAPPHIELQVQHQLLVSGLPLAYIGALVGGNRVILLKREANKDIQHAIMEKVAAFWKSIESDNQPQPDFLKDAKFISELYGYAEPGKVLDSSHDEVMQARATEYRKCSTRIKELEKERDALKAEMLMSIGDHEKVIGGDWTISAGLVGPAHIEYDRDGYRLFKLNWKKIINGFQKIQNVEENL